MFLPNYKIYMGTNNGKPYTYHSDVLYNKIRDEIKDLTRKYEFWTDENICDRLSLVYYDKLIQFKKSDLLDASTSIGIKHNSEKESDKICHQIINHYKKRIVLLRQIWLAIDKNRQKILQAKNGPICKNVDKYVGDLFTCEKVNGLWLNEDQYNKIIKRIKALGIYDNWLSHIQGLDNKWKKYMNYLQKVILIIKEDMDNTHDDEVFDQLSMTIDLVIKKMDYVCDIYYLLAVNYG